MTATTKVVDGMLRVRLNDAYVQAITDAGLVPLVVPPLDPDAAASVLDAVHGLVLTGGEDIDPSEYGVAKIPAGGTPHSARDKCEIALTRLAHERRLPTLAICRGIQVANVALGGSLVQDIATASPNALNHDQSRDRAARVHDVSVAADSRLAGIFGDAKISVNSSHHQALERVAPGLRVVAQASDGIIEGAEWTADDWWMVGVQWHPEELVRDEQSWDRRLFEAFARAVRTAERGQPASFQRASSST
jgi:putative glutamine amidotransferase